MMGFRFLLGRKDPNLQIRWTDVRKDPLKYLGQFVVVLILIAALAVAYEVIQPHVAMKGQA
ncbi:MAG: hypothetical protein ACR2PA_05980 [Hyphomicrobiaceae bacterium]